MLDRRNKWEIIILLAFCHLFIDGICASYIYVSIKAASTETIFYTLSAYNLLAFAFQPFVGLIADVKKNNKILLIFGLLISIIIAFIKIDVIIAAFILGIANSLIHIGGAGIVIEISDDRIAPLGVYVSLGAIGLNLGILYSEAKFYFAFLSIISLILVILLIKKSSYNELYEESIKKSKYNSYKFFILPLFLIIIAVFLRGFTGILASAQFQKKIIISIIISISVAGGKAAGGFIADKIGIIKTILIFFLPSILIMLLWRDIKFLYIIGLFCFNITMPLTLYLTIKCVKNYKNFTFGLTAGMLMLGTFIGQLINNNITILIVVSILLSAIFIIIAHNKLRRKKYENP